MKKGKLKQAGHLIAGIIIIIFGFSAFEQGDFKAAAGYLGVAILVLMAAGLHKFINRNFRQADVAFFLLEAVTLFYSAWEYREDGRFALSYFITAAGIGYFIWAIFTLIFHDRPTRHHSPQRSKRRRGSSSRSHH